MFKGFKNKGDKYESLIRYVYEQLSWASDRDIEVLRNQRIKGKSKQEHQIDVYYEFEQNGVTHKVIIECKNHKRRIDKGMIQSFKGVLDDIGNATGIFASANGFQKGAKKYAQYYDIELIEGNELPMLGKVLATKVGFMLPDENVVGQPFWTLMEVQNGSITGTYQCVGKNVIGLFMSKKTALEVANKSSDIVVRGINQKHLKMLLGFVKLHKMKVAVVMLDSKLAMKMSVEEISNYFVLE